MADLNAEVFKMVQAHMSAHSAVTTAADSPGLLLNASHLAPALHQPAMHFTLALPLPCMPALISMLAIVGSTVDYAHCHWVAVGSGRIDSASY